MIDMTNPFAAMGPAEPNPEDERRKALHAALMQSLAAPKPIEADVAANEAKMKQNQLESTIAKAGQMIGSGMLGLKSDGSNLATQNLDDSSKELLGKNLEMKKTLDEETKRRADIAKAFGLQDTQDAAQLDRQNKNNKDQIDRDGFQNEHTDKLKATEFGYNKELKGMDLAAAKAKAEAGSDRNDFKDETSLRKEIGMNPTIKNFDALNTQFESLNKLKGIDSGPADEARIVMFQKVLDPTSVVRESEFARTTQGQSLINRLEQYVGQVQTGRKLTPDMQKTLDETMGQLYEGSKSAAQNQMAKYYATIDKQGFGPDRVLPSWALEGYKSSRQQGQVPTNAVTAQAPAPVANSSGPRPGDVVRGYKFKGGEPHDKNNWEKVN